MVVLVVERRARPTAAGNTAMGTAAALAPVHAMWFLSVSSLVLLVNTVTIWWPWSESAKQARARVSPSGADGDC